jgi:hypothetical protein
MLKLTIEKLTKTPYVYEIRGGKNEWRNKSKNEGLFSWRFRSNYDK